MLQGWASTERRYQREATTVPAWPLQKCEMTAATPRKKAAKALRAGQRDNQSLVDSIDGIVWEADARTLQFDFVSRQAERLLGYPTKQWLEEPGFWKNHVHPDDRARAVEFCLKAAAQKRAHDFEYRMIAAGGHAVWLRDIVSVVVENGQPVKLRGVMVDVTEQKQAEAESRRLGQLLETAMTSISDYLWSAEVDPQGALANRYYSPVVEKITGRPPEFYMNSPEAWLSTIHPEDRPRLLEASRRVTSGQSAHEEEEYRIVRPDGAIRWLRDSAKATRLAEGSLRIDGVVSDVTERRAAAEAVRASEARYRLLVESAPICIHEIDLEGRLISMNRAGLKMMGVDSESQVSGTAYLDAVSAADQPRVSALLACALAGASAQFEFVAAGSGDQPRTFASRFIPIAGKDGALQKLMGLTEDISERRDAHRTLELQARQQAALAQLGQRALSGLDLATLMEETTAAVAKTLDVEYCKVLQLLPAGDVLLLRAGVGWKEGHVGEATVPAGSDSQAGYTLARGEAVIVEDLLTETRFSGPPLLRDHGVVSGLSVVIPGRHRPFGVLGAHTKTSRAFTPHEVYFVEAMANVLASGILRKREEEIRSQLLERVLFAQEQERREIARELHDETSQALTSLLVGLRTIQEARTLKQARQNAGRMRAIAAQTIDDLGHLARGIHPSALDDHGLVPAVTRYAQEHATLHGIAVDVDARGLEPRRLPPAVETTLYRIVQEALANVTKHAAAKTVHIVLRARDSEAELTVADDGMGFDFATLGEAATAGRLGLVGMRERAALLGGSVDVDSRPGEGTTVRVRLPLEGR